MLKLDLNNTHELACVGVLLSNNVFPRQGSNYILADGTKEQLAFFDDDARKYLEKVEYTKEYKAAYLMAVFMIEHKKQVPLMVHKLPNDKEILIPANTPKEEVKNLINKALR